jgi:hypothetical protein
MTNLIKSFLFVIWFLGLTSTLFSQTYRYINTVFPSAIKTADIVYDTAPGLTGLFVNESATEIEIYNSIGGLVRSFPTPTSEVSLELSDLETGMYFVKIGGVEAVQPLMVK